MMDAHFTKIPFRRLLVWCGFFVCLLLGAPALAEEGFLLETDLAAESSEGEPEEPHVAICPWESNTEIRAIFLSFSRCLMEPEPLPGVCEATYHIPWTRLLSRCAPPQAGPVSPNPSQKQLQTMSFFEPGPQSWGTELPPLSQGLLDQISSKAFTSKALGFPEPMLTLLLPRLDFVAPLLPGVVLLPDIPPRDEAALFCALS